MAVVGASARYGPNNPDPVRHVWTPRRASRTGVNHRALCGTSIRPYPWRPPGADRRNILDVQFDPDHPRACRACVITMSERAAAVARRHA